MNYLLANINVSSIKKVPLETKKLLETYAISYVFLVPEERMFLQHSPHFQRGKYKGDFFMISIRLKNKVYLFNSINFWGK